METQKQLEDLLNNEAFKLLTSDVLRMIWNGTFPTPPMPEGGFTLVSYLTLVNNDLSRPRIVVGNDHTQMHSKVVRKGLHPIDGGYLDPGQRDVLLITGNPGGNPLDVADWREKHPTQAARAISPAHENILQIQERLGLDPQRGRALTLAILNRMLPQAGIKGVRAVDRLVGRPYEKPPTPTGPVVFPELPER